MSTNRPFLANFLAAFRAQSTYKATTVTQSTNTLPSAQSITQSARAMTKATTTNHSHHNHHSSAARQPSSSPAATPHQYHHTTDPATASSTPIPINHAGTVPGPDRRRRGSDSSSGSGGFCDALGAEKWYIGGRTPAGEERFYRLGMVTNGGGRLGGGGRVGSIDQLSL